MSGKRLEFLMQIFNIDGIRYGNTPLNSPSAKFSSVPIFPAIW